VIQAKWDKEYNAAEKAYEMEVLALRRVSSVVMCAFTRRPLVQALVYLENEELSCDVILAS
jgi:hypothetical protein